MCPGLRRLHTWTSADRWCFSRLWCFSARGGEPDPVRPGMSAPGAQSQNNTLKKCFFPLEYCKFTTNFLTVEFLPPTPPPVPVGLSAVFPGQRPVPFGCCCPSLRWPLPVVVSDALRPWCSFPCTEVGPYQAIIVFRFEPFGLKRLLLNITKRIPIVSTPNLFPASYGRKMD